jgi:hypothetical protein
MYWMNSFFLNLGGFIHDSKEIVHY